jgi:hypothetical protein
VADLDAYLKSWGIAAAIYAAWLLLKFFWDGWRGDD